jgi:hypothetical protein
MVDFQIGVHSRGLFACLLDCTCLPVRLEGELGLPAGLLVLAFDQSGNFLFNVIHAAHIIF